METVWSKLSREVKPNTASTRSSQQAPGVTHQGLSLALDPKAKFEWARGRQHTIAMCNYTVSPFARCHAVADRRIAVFT